LLSNAIRFFAFVTDLKKFKQTKWAVTEKIHGANFCFVVDPDDTVKAGNRRQLIAESDDFFGHRDLVDRLKPMIVEAARLIRSLKSEATRCYIYGELFGGIYPHPEVAKNEKVQAVQTGIYYSPNIEFAAFDIAFDTNATQRRQFLDFGDAVTVFERAKIFFAAPLFVGKYEQAIDYSPAFDSTISRRLGFPKIPNHQNKAEGVVVRPMKEILVSSKKGMVRAVIKNKIPEFKEDKRFHAAVKWDNNDKASSTSTTQASNDVSIEDSLFYEACALITEQRIENAISKFGRPAKTEREKLRTLFDIFCKDVMDQLRDDNEEVFSQFRAQNASGFGSLERRIKEEASVLFKSHFGLK
jgi:Rnl2 family RNA ligase